MSEGFQDLLLFKIPDWVINPFLDASSEETDWVINPFLDASSEETGEAEEYLLH